ncbi:septal ring lytic transglycosylase RlpA family protein [Uruburuella testudinis]
MGTASAESGSGLTSAVGHSRQKADIAMLPDAAVKAEKLHRSANMSYKVAGKRYYPIRKVAEFSQTGKASWYGSQFHGRKTSSGERYDMNMMTAAHKTLPIPSYARVTNLSNGKSVVVRINDRGPFHSSRVLDVSKAAAQKLGFIRQGTANVRVEQIVPGAGGLAAAPKSGNNIYVNLQSFASEAEAKSYLARTSGHLKAAAGSQKVIMVKQNNQYVVRMGPFARQEHAENMKRQVQTAI